MLFRSRRPDLVLSGINRGANLGEDVTYSGTIAAAMEATLLGVPAVALSLVAENDETALWPTAAAHFAKVMGGITTVGWPKDVFINVNFPDRPADEVTGVEVTRQGRHKLGDELWRREDPRGRPYYWIGPVRTEDPTRQGSDLAAVNAGAISITPLYLDLTHARTMARLRSAFR